MTSKKDQGYLNVHDVDPDIIVDLKYATTDNFTHQIVYDFDQAISRIDTVKKLGNASKILKDQGYRLRIWDAYRPIYAQKRLFEVYPDPIWVAEPNPNFSHQKGVTFDLTLTDQAGNNMEMPTPFDDFTGLAKRSEKPNWSTEAQKNYDILNHAMTQAGFVGYENEWWDYRDSNADKFGPLEVDPKDY
ncbi:MAG: M15 family metallopeptidase [Lentilactobacillus hilgardii]|uniref:M15 family metallopeptidase n=1 Tax=Lentilactobacillus hilgardii TaxID=1588 RepID=UPI001CC2146A|nr:M15 family metallopeptidase [Lentilactobacillus hilgardii]MBZ2200048.1 D-alanyl-D-alanine dipeptidase [Lentilactobacillus hilgardii]MBZ2203168.1 D-alanyl-D-alanine dipeptidase [Lentilactobacillus hilgardii]